MEKLNIQMNNYKAANVQGVESAKAREGDKLRPDLF